MKPHETHTQSDDANTTKQPQHESGEPHGRSDEHATRSVGRQAHRDVESGMQDTDRRGGDDYQKRTGNGAHVNRKAGQERH